MLLAPEGNVWAGTALVFRSDLWHRGAANSSAGQVRDMLQCTMAGAWWRRSFPRT